MQFLDDYRLQLQAIREGQLSLDGYLFAPVTHEDGSQSDAQQGVRLRLLLALQLDRLASDEQLLAPLLEAEIQRHRIEPLQGLYPALSLACALLARFENAAHLPLFINAKRANFDTHCGLDVQYLVSAGISQSYTASHHLDEELRSAFHDYLGDTPAQCKISEQALQAWQARLTERYPQQWAFTTLDEEMDFLLELGEQDLARRQFSEWRATVFEATTSGWQALRSWARVFHDVPATIEACEALLSWERDDWGRASILHELGGLYLQVAVLDKALEQIQALQGLQPHFKEWRKLGMGRFIAELYLDYVLATHVLQPASSAQVYAWVKALTQGMKGMHWNLLEKLIQVHALYGNVALVIKYRKLLRRERRALNSIL